VIVNAAAYTAVDKAESERTRRFARQRRCAPGVLAEEAQRLGAWLVHYSTDYVFDGSKDGAYVEGRRHQSAESVYGRTKCAGEEAIRAALPRHLILRTSWVFAAQGGNFAKTMLRLAKEREQPECGRRPVWRADQRRADRRRHGTGAVPHRRARAPRPIRWPAPITWRRAARPTGTAMRNMCWNWRRLPAALKTAPAQVLSIPTSGLPLAGAAPK
jgi:hypothetical protein